MEDPDPNPCQGQFGVPMMCYDTSYLTYDHTVVVTNDENGYL